MAYIKPNYDKHDMDKPEDKRRIISFRIAVPVGKEDNGKPRYHWETVKTDSISVVRKRIRAIESDNDNGVYIKPGKLTVKEYLSQWLEDYCKPNLSPDSTETYRIMCDVHIIPDIGSKPLTSLKAQDIQHLESQKLLSGRRRSKGGLSNRSVKYIHDTLNKSLKMAVKMGLLTHNPVDGVQSPKVKRHEFKTMNEDDINKFLEIIKDNQYYPLFFTDLFSGMRRSELLALRWGDLDLDPLVMTASVNRTIKVLKKGEIKYSEPKTEKSRRLIALTPANAVILRKHLESRIQFLKSLNPKFDPKKDFNQNELVFCRYDGKPYLPNSITHVWTKLTKRNGFNGIRLHDVRHTHASLLLKQGVHPKIVQERLGHATISTTLDTYSHIAPGLQAAAAANFDNIIKPKSTKLDKELQEITK